MTPYQAARTKVQRAALAFAASFIAVGLAQLITPIFHAYGEGATVALIAVAAVLLLTALVSLISIARIRTQP